MIIDGLGTNNPSSMTGGSNKSRAIITTNVIEFEYRKVNYFVDTVDPWLFDPW